jgi:hypothetical protein
VDADAPLQVEELTREMLESLPEEEWKAVMDEMRFSLELLGEDNHEESLYELQRVQGRGLDPFIPDCDLEWMKACRAVKGGSA